MAEWADRELTKLGTEYLGRSVSPDWRRDAAVAQDILRFLESIGVDVTKEKAELEKLERSLWELSASGDNYWEAFKALTTLLWRDLCNIMDEIAPIGTSFRMKDDNFGFWPKGL